MKEDKVEDVANISQTIHLPNAAIALSPVVQLQHGGFRYCLRTLGAGEPR